MLGIIYHAKLGNQSIPPRSNRRNKSIGMENVWSRYHAKIGELGNNIKISKRYVGWNFLLVRIFY